MLLWLLLPFESDVDDTTPVADTQRTEGYRGNYKLTLEEDAELTNAVANLIK
jgi:hypothetical protein